MTTRKMVEDWTREGKEQGAKHTIIVCDCFDYEDYPVHIFPHDDLAAKIREYNDYSKMSKIMEVIDH